jgi:ATP-binding cassette subfamily B protein
VFAAGAIVEAGTFEALVAKGGRFARLAEAQFLTPQAEAPAP